MEKYIKILLSILFLICLFHLPYVYYVLVRFFAMLGFALLAWNAFKRGEEVQIIIYIALALLFQPFWKIALGRTLWNVVDVVLAVCLLGSLFIKNKNK